MVLLQRLGHIVEEVLVDRAGRPAFEPGAIVGNEHDQRIVELTGHLQKIEQTADMMVGMLEESGEDLHHPGVELSLVRGAFVPRLDIRIVARQLGIGGNDSHWRASLFR